MSMEVKAFNLNTISLWSSILLIISLILLMMVFTDDWKFKRKHVTYIMRFIEPIIRILMTFITMILFVIMSSSFCIRGYEELREPLYSYEIQDFSLESSSRGFRTAIKDRIVSIVDLNGTLETFKVLNVQINENCNTNSVEYYDKVWFKEHLYINKETVVINLDRELTEDELKKVEESNN